MAMHDPLHPGEFLRAVYMEPFGITRRAWLQSSAYLLQP